MRFVRANTRCASWRMSVFNPISPTKCGITAPGLVFWISVEDDSRDPRRAEA
jgi:hypothetical protein